MVSDVFNTSYNTYPQGMVLANTASGGLLIFLLLIVIGTVLLVALITSLERFTKFFKMFDKLISSIKYTIFGAGITVALYSIYTICVLLAEFGSGINPIHIGLGIGGYIAFTLLGYIATKVISKFNKMHEEYKKLNKETLNDGT